MSRARHCSIRIESHNGGKLQVWGGGNRHHGDQKRCFGSRSAASQWLYRPVFSFLWCGQSIPRMLFLEQILSKLPTWKPFAYDIWFQEFRDRVWTETELNVFYYLLHCIIGYIYFSFFFSLLYNVYNVRLPGVVVSFVIYLHILFIININMCLIPIVQNTFIDFIDTWPKHEAIFFVVI